MMHKILNAIFIVYILYMHYLLNGYDTQNDNLHKLVNLLLKACVAGF